MRAQLPSIQFLLTFNQNNWPNILVLTLKLWGSFWTAKCSHFSPPLPSFLSPPCPLLPLMQWLIIPCQAGARSHPVKCQRAAISFQQIVLSLNSGWWDEWQAADSPVLQSPSRRGKAESSHNCFSLGVHHGGRSRDMRNQEERRGELKIKVRKTVQSHDYN